MSPTSEQRAAFVQLYERHYAAVLSYARRRVPEDAARDVAAETFLVAWRRSDVATAGGLPWLYATAGHAVSTWRRAQRRRGALDVKVNALPQPSGAPDHAAAHAERDAVLDAVRELPPVDRELLLLTVWEQLDVATAAGVAGCSVGAAHVRLHRARRRLRVLLTARGLAPPRRRLPGPDLDPPASVPSPSAPRHQGVHSVPATEKATS